MHPIETHHEDNASVADETIGGLAYHHRVGRGDSVGLQTRALHGRIQRLKACFTMPAHLDDAERASDSAHNQCGLTNRLKLPARTFEAKSSTGTSKSLDCANDLISDHSLCSPSSTMPRVEKGTPAYVLCFRAQSASWEKCFPENQQSRAIRHYEDRARMRWREAGLRQAAINSPVMPPGVRRSVIEPTD